MWGERVGEKEEEKEGRKEEEEKKGKKDAATKMKLFLSDPEKIRARKLQRRRTHICQVR
jgi:hypothetical protein